MIHTCQVQHAVQHQDADLVGHAMPIFGGLSRCTIQGNRQLTTSFGWERQNIRGMIPIAKFSIEPPHFAIIGDETRYTLPPQDSPRDVN